MPHGVPLDGEQLFFSHVHLHGGPAPVRRYLPELIKLVLEGKINPGKVFDLVLPLDRVAEGYRAMDERRAIKTFYAVRELASSVVLIWFFTIGKEIAMAAWSKEELHKIAEADDLKSSDISRR